MSAKRYNDSLEDISVKYNLILERYIADLISTFASARPKGTPQTTPTVNNNLKL